MDPRYRFYCGECYGSWEKKFMLDLMEARRQLLEEPTNEDLAKTVMQGMQILLS